MDRQPTGGDVLLAILAYLPVLNLLALIKKTKDRFLLYHTRQGLYVFSFFLVVLVVLLALFYLFHEIVPLEFVENVLAVMVVLALGSYLVIVLYMTTNVLKRRMPMLPILGELAGER